MKADLIHYLTFYGDCAEAMQFYKDALGGELSMTFMRDSPMAAQCEPEQMNYVLHSQLRGDGFRLMASDVLEESAAPNSRTQLSLNMYTDAEAVAAFEALSAGGTIVMPLQQTFWAKKFGMFTDKYGFRWTLNFE